MAEYLGLIDMLNGGGAGRAGQTFEGGPLSGLLNSLGVRPMGYQDRLAAARPMPRPMAMPSAPQPAATAISGQPAEIYGPGAVDVMTLSDAQLVEMIRNALAAPPSATGYGPR